LCSVNVLIKNISVNASKAQHTDSTESMQIAQHNTCNYCINGNLCYKVFLLNAARSRNKTWHILNCRFTHLAFGFCKFEFIPNFAPFYSIKSVLCI